MDFLGAPYPIEKTPKGFLCTQTGVNQIKSDLLTLLLTNPGDRVMLPAYGTALSSLIFEQNDTEVADAAKQMIIDSINQWEPRVTIQQIEVGVGSSDLNSEDDGTQTEHILGIKILFYDPENIQEVQELKLEVPL